MRRIGIIVTWAALFAASASAQDMTQQQREAVDAFATAMVASQECDFDLSVAALGEMAESRGLTPDLLNREPYAGAVEAETKRARSEIAEDEAGFCERVWNEYGAQGSIAQGVMTR